MNYRIVFSMMFLGFINVAYSQDPIDRLARLDSVPLREIRPEAGFASIFRLWGFIGDSLTSGEHEYQKEDGKKGYIDLYEYSWGQFICYATGAKGTNFSKGGLTTRSWLNQFWDRAEKDPKQAYIIAIGVNDRNRKVKIGSFETDLDTCDFNKNADTFVGNYAGIIQRIKSIQPDAKIFVCTLYKKEDPQYNESVELYNNVIRKMHSLFTNVYTLDLYQYAPQNNDAFRERYYNGGHNNSAGYLYSSWILMNYIDWTIRNDFRAFAEVALIGKNKSLYKTYK